LDSEALAMAATQHSTAKSFLSAALRDDAEVVIPAVVLAELMTGGPTDAQLWHLIRRLTTVDITARLAARAGALREGASGKRRKKRDLTVDAMVAAVAELLAPSVILTGDAGDLSLLSVGLDVRVADINSI
jgi:predicted nucleic acid-binding protein